MINDQTAKVCSRYGTEQTLARMRTAYDVSVYTIVSEARRNLTLEEIQLSLAVKWPKSRLMGPAWGDDPTWAFQPDNVRDSVERLASRNLVRLQGSTVILPVRNNDQKAPFILMKNEDKTDYRLLREVSP